MSLLGNIEKAFYQQVIRDLHDSFARTITGYKPINITSFSETSNYNYLYTNNDPSLILNTQTSSGIFQSRVKYIDINLTSEYTQKIVLEDSSIKKGQALVQFKFDKAGYAWLKDAQYIQLDDVKLKKISERRNHGLFTPEYISQLWAEVV